MQLSLRVRQLGLWYFEPVLVMYTVPEPSELEDVFFFALAFGILLERHLLSELLLYSSE